MEKKKSNRTNLEKMRTVFFQSGLILALVLMILAFEWKTPIGNLKDLGTTSFINDDFELPPITKLEKPKPPEIIKKRDDFEIKKDDEKLKEEFEAESSESDENTVVDVDSTLYDIGNDVEETEPIEPYLCEIMPKFPGGDEAMFAFISENFEIPKLTLENKSNGKIFIAFIVDEKGNIKDARIERGLDPFADKEALRVVNMMPKWDPGIQQGKKVKVNFRLPIKIKI